MAALTKQVQALESELKERNEKLETANERLSDRDLEISILQKRLELRASLMANRNSNSKTDASSSSSKHVHKIHDDLSKCSGCSRKDGLISCLFEKGD